MIICILLVTFSIVSFLIVRYVVFKGDFAVIPEELSSNVRTGDLIFSKGHSFKSDIVRMGGKRKSDISHVGFIQVKEDSVYVVHMSIDDDKIMSEPLETFIVRNKVRGYSLRRLMPNIDIDRLDGVLDSLLRSRIAFDNHYNMVDDTEYYCTELICKTLYKIGLTEMADMEFDKILFPTDLMTHKDLEEIYSNI